MREPKILPLETRRQYSLGIMTAVFKTDGEESANRYSVSEWWMEPGSEGGGAHHHDDNDEIFFVLEGKPEIPVGENWRKTMPGDTVIVPAGNVHDFRNLTDRRAGLLNVYIPGDFECNMPYIVEWFASQTD